MVNINKIKLSDIDKSVRSSKSAVERMAMHDLRRAYDLARSIHQPSITAILREQSIAQKAFNAMNSSAVVQASRLAREISSASKFNALSLSNIVDRHLTTFNKVSTAMDSLYKSGALSIVDRINEQSVLKHSMDSLQDLIPSTTFSAMSSAISSAKRIKELMEASSFTHKYLDSLRVESLHNYLTDLYARNGININTDGTVQVNDETIDSDELNNSIQDLFSHFNDDDFIDNFFERLKKYKKPIQATILWLLDRIVVGLILGYAIYVYAPSVQEYLSQFSYSSKQEVTKQVKQLPPEIDLSDLPDYRVVTAKLLHLRKNASRSSSSIVKLKIGQLVRVIKKQKSWTFVEVSFEDSDAKLRGWVFTRYLTKLKR